MRVYLILSFFLLTISGAAQQADTNYIKSTEFGFGTAGFNNLFLSVKMGTKKGLFIKLQTEEIKWEQYQYDSTAQDTQIISRAFGLRIGLEKRKWISQSIQVGIGADLFYQRELQKLKYDLVTYSNSLSNSTRDLWQNWASNFGVSIPVTAYYSLPNQRIHFWLEWAPNMTFSRDVFQELDTNETVKKEEKYKTFSLNLVNQNNIRFGAAFRFWKP